MNLSDLLTDRAAKFGDREFLFFERQPASNASNNIVQDSFRQTLTYRELDDHVNQACHFLSSLGLVRGDVFNLHLPNCPAFLILWFAGARLGAIMMPTNVLASVDELDYLLEHSSSRVAFTTVEHLAILEQCERNIDGLEKIILCDPYTADPAADSFEALLRDQPHTACNCPLGETDMVAIMYTSGTTSKPKGVMVTHANYLAAGQTVADAIELTEDDRHFIVVLHQGHHVESTELIEFCAGKLAKFRVPQQVIIMDSLPKTSVGKIQKHLIRNELITARD